MVETSSRNGRSPFFSVIVPVYNVEAYLEQCLDSILSQTFDDFELFLVDDCSPDGSGAICDAYAERDTRVTVIHKKANEGQGAARNTALDACAGKYVLFVDSDDFLTSDAMFERLAEKANENEPDVILFSYKKFFDSTGAFSHRIIGKLPDNCDRQHMIAVNAYKALVCNKVVKRSLIQNAHLRFPVIRAGEDLQWCAYLLAAERIAFCDIDCYAYRQRSGSTSGVKGKSAKKRNLWESVRTLEACAAQYGIDGKVGKETDIIGEYLAYEYSWLLAEVFPFWSEFARKMRELSFLLNYRLNRKAEKVRALRKLFGLRLTSFALYSYISLRPNRL